MFKTFNIGVFLLLICSFSFAQENRSYTGFNNNLVNKDWGASFSNQIRKSTVDYLDGMSEINDNNRPTPRYLSNTIFSQQDDIFDSHDLSDYVWVFGQFLDHDITLVESNNREPILLTIPDDDEWFTPQDFIFTSRNEFAHGSGESINNPRQYENLVTSFVDGSAVYGSSQERADWLRALDGTGKLKVSKGDLLPWNTVDGERNGDIDPTSPFMADDTRVLDKWYVAGDIRANENPLLIAMHTLFVREHNRLCDELRANHPNWTGEQIYQRARKFVGAYLQNITFYEFLPALGVNLSNYPGYRENVDPAILNEFSAAAFRIGHTMINSNLIRMSNDGDEIPQGNITLRDAFFNPNAVELAGGVESYFKGMGSQVMQEMDCKIIDDLRNFLFGPPGAGGLDLAAINIFRGRDRGLTNYNQMRFDFGLPMVNTFEEFVEYQEDAVILSEMYGTVDNIDAWVGMLAERHKEGAILGELVMRIIEEQFENLRNGDRFYFENDPVFTPSDISDIQSTTMHKILMRNTDISVMQKNLFVAMPHENIPTGPELSNQPLAAVAYPNPVQDVTTIKIKSDKEQIASLKIYDAQGRMLSESTHSLYDGDNFISLTVDPSWPIGIYNLYIESPGQFNIVKLIRK